MSDQATWDQWCDAGGQALEKLLRDASRWNRFADLEKMPAIDYDAVIAAARRNAHKALLLVSYRIALQVYGEQFDKLALFVIPETAYPWQLIYNVAKAAADDAMSELHREFGGSLPEKGWRAFIRSRNRRLVDDAIRKHPDSRSEAIKRSGLPRSTAYDSLKPRKARTPK